MGPLVELLLPTLEVHCSNPVNCNFSYRLSTVFKDENKGQLGTLRAYVFTLLMQWYFCNYAYDKALG